MELDAAGIDGTILVQSLDNYEETLHYLDVAEANDFIRAVVGWVPLADPAACAQGARRAQAAQEVRRHAPSHRLREGPALAAAAHGAGIAREFRKRRTGVRGDHQHRGADGDGARNRAAHAGPQHRDEPLGRPPLPEKGWEPWASQMVRSRGISEHQRQAVGRRRRGVALAVVHGRNPPLLRSLPAALRRAPRHGRKQLAGGADLRQLPGGLERHQGLAVGACRPPSGRRCWAARPSGFTGCARPCLLP